VIKNAIIAALFLCLVGALGYIVGQESGSDSLPLEVQDREPQRPPTNSGVWSGQVTDKKFVVSENTIAYKKFDAPLLSWTSQNRAEVELIGIALNRLDEQQNDLLLLFDVNIQHGGFCAGSVKHVFRRITNSEGDLSAPTGHSKACDVAYTSLNDQWLAFAADSEVREFHLWMPPTSPSEGTTPTGEMHIAISDSKNIDVRLEGDD
jgi:hypothetical protein